MFIIYLDEGLLQRRARAYRCQELIRDIPCFARKVPNDVITLIQPERHTVAVEIQDIQLEIFVEVSVMDRSIRRLRRRNWPR